MQDDYDLYPDAEAFTIPEREPRQTSVAAEKDSELVEPELTDPSIVAPARRARKRKVLLNDDTMELDNQVLARWSREYASNMQEAINSQRRKGALALARSNADFWVLSSGLGGLGRLLGPERIPDPLQMFTGTRLLESLTGLRLTTAGEKHDRDDEAEQGEGEQARRVRSRTEGQEVGRGDVDVPMDDVADLSAMNYDDVRFTLGSMC